MKFDVGLDSLLFTVNNSPYAGVNHAHNYPSTCGWYGLARERETEPFTGAVVIKGVPGKELATAVRPTNCTVISARLKVPNFSLVHKGKIVGFW